jgi:hypothetical protein
MAAEAGPNPDDVVGQPSIITIFISAHSVELEKNLNPGIEVRLLNSQAVPGNSNFEDSTSIQEKLVYWTNAFKTRRNKPTINVLEEGVEVLNEKAMAELKPSIVSEIEKTWIKRIRLEANGEMVPEQRALLIKQMQQIVTSGEPMDAFTSPELKDSKNQIRFQNIFLEKNTFQKLAKLGITDIQLNKMIKDWIDSQQADLREREDSTKSRISRVVKDKAYSLGPNPGEAVVDVKNSLYGIHLVQDSKNEAGIHTYPATGPNYSNLLMTLRILSTNDDVEITDDTTYNVFSNPSRPATKSASTSFLSSFVSSFYSSPVPIEKQPVTIKTKANEYFGPKLGWTNDKPDRPYQNTIYLSEIVQFFQEQGYDIVNIIDTGCRTFDMSKGVPIDALEKAERARKLIENERKIRRNNPFSRFGITSKRSKSKHRKRSKSKHRKGSKHTK